MLRGTINITIGTLKLYRAKGSLNFALTTTIHKLVKTVFPLWDHAKLQMGNVMTFTGVLLAFQIIGNL